MADTELLAGSAPSYSQCFGSVFNDTGTYFAESGSGIQPVDEYNMIQSGYGSRWMFMIYYCKLYKKNFWVKTVKNVFLKPNKGRSGRPNTYGSGGSGSGSTILVPAKKLEKI
jgi:hypothetical protein